MNTPLETQLEALLFYQGGTMSIKELSKATHTSESSVTEALSKLKESLKDRGIILIKDGTLVGLGTTPAVADLIESVRRDELAGFLGRAGLETLAIIIYKGPISRSDIEYIRGVNVSSMLRTLMIRGLINRVENPKDKRSFLYTTTPELAAHFGVSSLSDLPEFESVKAELQGVLDQSVPEPV